mmetsp:Transcript_11949/g.32309  ORF Transcript_11949/g.32309 Transcript_11949/m.32309 type:complete len:236 (+) Transcript_11949:64-771(+)
MGATSSQCCSPQNLGSSDKYTPRDGNDCPVPVGKQLPSTAYSAVVAPPECDAGDEAWHTCQKGVTVACFPLQPNALSDAACINVLLAQAAVRGELSDVKRALDQGAKVDTCAELQVNLGVRDRKRIKRVTPLMRACANGHEDVVASLLAAGASHSRYDSRGWTPLCYALGAGELNLARKLLQQMEGNAAQQKAIAQNLKSELVEECEDCASELSAAELLKEFGPDGFLFAQLQRA